MSAATGTPLAAPDALADGVRRRRGIPGLRGTGAVGHLCAAVILLAVLVAALGASLATYDPNEIHLAFSFVGPVGDHYLGFDGQGRDIFSRVLVGAGTSVAGPLAVVVIAMAVGTTVAVAAAWIGGRFDASSSVILDVLFAFPGILLAVIAAAIFGTGLTAATVALAIAYTPYIARVLRAAALRERTQQYIAALEVQGLGAWLICLRHLVPNMLGLVVAQGTILFGYAMVDLAAISFIGLGVQPPQADWGVMVAGGQSGLLQGYPTESISAGLCIVTVVIAVNVLGERLTERTQEVRR